MGPGHTMLGHAALVDLFSDFAFFVVVSFCFYYVFHLRSCQECNKWDSQAARVTVHHHHHHYHQHHHHHHYYHSPKGIIIIISSSFNFFLNLENNLHHIVFTDFETTNIPATHSRNKVGNNQKSMTFCIVVNEQRH